jgi:hypothetical protein
MNLLKNLARQGLMAAGLTGIIAAGSVQAATSNPVNPGATSTGTVDVSVVVPDVVWIQNLDPVVLGYTAGSDATANESFCVTSSTGAYQITFTSLNTAPGNTNITASGPSGAVQYNVLFDDDADASAGGSTVTTGTAITGNSSGYVAVPPSCASGDNASFFVTFLESGNLDSALAGTYTDELTLLVEPE